MMQPGITDGHGLIVLLLLVLMVCKQFAASIKIIPDPEQTDRRRRRRRRRRCRRVRLNVVIGGGVGVGAAARIRIVIRKHRKRSITVERVHMKVHQIDIAEIVQHDRILLHRIVPSAGDRVKVDRL